MNKLCLLIIFHLIFSAGYSQKKVLIKGVTGSSIIANITPEEALRKAINSAKIEALRKAGISEIIHSTDFLSSTEINEKFDQIFNSISAVEIQGEVIDYKIVNKNNYTDESGNLICEVTLNTEVIKYKSGRDEEFRFKTEGIKSVYQEGSMLEFSFYPYREGYLHIFLFKGTADATVLFPNNYEKDSFFKTEEEYDFPLNKMIEYELYCNNGLELNHLAFVFTKKNIPFNVEPGYKSVIKWIFSIEPNERYLIHKSFTIIK